MANVSVFQALASSLLAENGQTVQIRRIVDGALGSTPWKPGAPTTADEPIASAIFGISDFKNAGTLTQAGDKIAYISAVDLTGPKPTTADLLVVGGVPHKVITVDTVSPSGDDILYKVVIRQ